ncbi:centrosomal protein CCDC61-like [Saccostrea cucullata]|uniref:centrosomal protein CCDC61-like n=1 Tax=Saccostrea cuccullata TaxID=36930 RepID=UPI002ED2E5D7
MEVPDETTLSTSYVFRGIEYIITIIIQGGNSLTVEVEDRLTADQWRAQFDSAYIEDLTHKTGNFKQFHIFTSMLESAITQSSDSVSLDLLTFADLESLRQRKVGSTAKTSIPANRTVSLNSKRYLILTYTVEFDRIHYPLPLPYMGKPDPRALQETIRQLREELKSLRHQGGSDFRSKEVEKLQKENKALLKEKEEIEEEFLRYRREMKNTPTGNAVKEIRMLKSVTKNLEEELMKEKTRHQRSTSKRSQEYRDLLEEVEELRASERNLRVRVKSLTNELAVYKRDRVRTSRPQTRERFNNSRERSGSFSRERSLSRDRSWSSDRFSTRDRSLSRERHLSRERPSSANNNSRFSNRSSSSYSNRNNYKPRSRTPSPAGARNPRFDPTAYIKDKERKKKEASMKKQRNVRSKMNTSNRSKPSPQHISRPLRNRSRTSSFGSAGELSDGGFSDSSYSRLRVLNRNSQRNHHRNSSVESSKGSYLSSPDIPQKTRSRTGSGRQNKVPVSSTPDNEVRTRRKRPQHKENIPLSGDDSDSFDRSAEISEIDARLARLQQMMKNSIE